MVTAGLSMVDTGGLAAKETATWKASREADRSSSTTTLLAGISRGKRGSRIAGRRSELDDETDEKVNICDGMQDIGERIRRASLNLGRTGG